MLNKMTTAPEDLLKLISPEATNLLNLLKQIKQVDEKVTVLLTKVLPFPEAYGCEARALSGILMQFGGSVLRAGTVVSSTGWCWLELEPYGYIDEEYLRTHWDAVIGGLKPLLDEVGAISAAPRLGGISFIM